LQELAIQLDLIGFPALTSPSLQDFLYQKLRYNSLLLGHIFGFTNPSLQALKSGVFYPVPSAKYDFVSHIPGFGPCISPSNQDFAPANTVCCPFGPAGILDHSSFFGAAKVFSQTLAIWSVAVSMIFYPRIRNKETSAASICTSDLLVHGFHPPGKTITSSRLV